MVSPISSPSRWLFALVAALVLAVGPLVCSADIACSCSPSTGISLDLSGTWDIDWPDGSEDCVCELTITPVLNPEYWVVMVSCYGTDDCPESANDDRDNQFNIRTASDNIIYSRERNWHEAVTTVAGDDIKLDVRMDEGAGGDFDAYWWPIVDADTLVTAMRDFVTNSWVGSTRIGLGVKAMLTLDGDGVGSFYFDAAKDHTRIGFASTSAAGCENPVNVVGLSSDDEILVGPFFVPGNYLFCVSGDGGQVFHIQSASVFIEVLDYAPSNIAGLDHDVVVVSHNSQNSLVEVAPSDVSEFTLVGFVPEGTPCNAPIIENVGQWREQRWDGDFGTTPSDLYSMPGYPGKPTMTFLRDVSESAIGQCDVCGMVIDGLYIPQYTEDHRFQMSGNSGHECFFSDDRFKDGEYRIMGPSTYQDYKVWGTESAIISFEENDPHYMSCRAKESHYSDFVSVRKKNVGDYLEGASIALPVDHARSADLSWVGVARADTTSKISLPVRIDVPGFYQLCVSTDDGASWTAQDDQKLQVVDHYPTAITSIAQPTNAILYEDVLTTVEFRGNLRLDGTDQGRIRLMRPGTTGCSNGDKAIAILLYTSDTHAITLSDGVGVYRICYTSTDGPWIEQTAVRLTVISTTSNTVTSISPARVGPGATFNIQLSGLTQIGDNTEFSFCADPCAGCAAPIAITSPVDEGGGPFYTITGPASPGDYNLCLRDPVTFDWVGQAGVKLTVLAGSDLTRVEPSVVGLGTNPVIGFVGAQLSDLGTFVAFTSVGSCASRAAETKLTSFNQALNDALPASGVWTACYSVDGGNLYTILNGVTVTVVEATDDMLGGVTPASITVAAAAVTLTFDSVPDIPGLLGSTTQNSEDTGSCSNDFPLTSVSNVATAPGSPTTVYFCVSVDGGLTWVVQNFGLAVLPVIANNDAGLVLLSPAIGTRYTPGETASIRVAVPAGAWPAPMVGLSTGPATCGDLGSMQGAGGYAWVGTGTSIEIPLDNVFNTVQSNSVSPSLCFSPDGGLTWIGRASQSISVLNLHPRVVTAFSPSTIVSGNTVLVTQMVGVTTYAGTRVRLADNPGCNVSPIGAAGTAKSVAVTPSIGTPLNLGVATAPPGVLHLCLSLDGGSVWLIQPSVPITVIGAGAATAIDAINPTAVALGAPFSVNLTFSDGNAPGASTTVGFSLNTDCSVPTSEVAYPDTNPVFPPGLTVGDWNVCWDDGTAAGSIAQQVSGVGVNVVDAVPGSVTAVEPDTLVEGMTPTVTFTGAVGTATSRVGLSTNGCTSIAGATDTPLALSDVDTVNVDTSGLIAGSYAVCYQTLSTWVQQGPTVTILAAAPDSLSNLSPAVVGENSGSLVVVDGVDASPTTQIGFGVGNCAAPTNVVAYTVPGQSVAIETSLVAGDYVMCYTVNNGAGWVQQTDGSTNFRVVAASPTAISNLTPDTIAALTKPSVTVAGLAVADLTATSEIGFGVLGGCAPIFGRTSIAGGLTQALGSALPTSQSSMTLCYSVDGGSTWSPQAQVVTVVTAEDDSISSVTETVFGVNHPSFSLSFVGAYDAGYTYVAFASSAAACSQSRQAQTQFTGNPVTLAVPVAVANSAYVVCYTMNGPSQGWKAQDGLTVNVIKAQANSITAVNPIEIGAGTTPDFSFVGATPSPSSWIGFGTGGCASVDSAFRYTSAVAVTLPSSLTTAHDTVCYSTDDATSYVVQSAVQIEVIDAAPTSITDLTPSVVGAESLFEMNVAGQGPTPDAQLGFAALGNCAVGPVVGVTDYLGTSDLAVGTPIASPGLYQVCYTVDGLTWVGQVGPNNVTVLTASPTNVIAVSPPAIGMGTTPQMSVNINATQLTTTVYVGWSLDPGCGVGSVDGATRVTSIGPNSVRLGSGIPAPGLYTTCLSFGGAVNGWVPQTAAPSLVVTNAVAGSITDIQPRLVTSDVPPTLTLTGITPTPTTRLSFAPVGECLLPASRFGETIVTAVGDVGLASALSTGMPYVEMAACYSTNDGATWVEQTTVTIEVTAECSTLTTCGDCHANEFCTYCLATGECGLAVTGCPAIDTVTVNDTCPAIVTFDPQRGDVTGNTPVTIGFDYLAHDASNATTTEMACSWAVGPLRLDTPFVSFNATHGTCLSPPSSNNAPASAMSVTWDGVVYSSETLFFIYYNCSVADYSCGDCVVREAECGFCLETQLCGPERSCVNGTTFTKASCPRVNEVEPDAINFRGGDEVVLAGALFVDVGEVQCAFDGVPMGAGETTFVSSSEVRCVAPPGEAETQVDVGIWVDGREYTTTPGRLFYEDDPAEVVDNSVVTYAAVGGGALALILVIVACCLCVCLRRRKKETYLPPKLTAAQERDLMFGKSDGISHGKDLYRALNQFIDLVLMADKSIVNYICDVVPSTEADLVAKSLIVLHETVGQSVPLMRARIGHEVDQALSLATLFRTNSVATKMFKTYSRMAGLHYVRDTLGYEINFNLAQFADDDLDIKKAKGTEDDVLNKFNLLTVCQKVFVAIAKSEPRVPLAFRSVFEHVRESVEERFPIRAEDLAVVIAGGLNQSLDETEENYSHSAETFALMQNARGEVNADLAALAAVLPALTGDLSTLNETMDSLNKKVKRIIQSFSELEGALDPDSPAAARLLEEHANKQNAVAVGGFFFLRFMIPAITNPVGFQLVAEMPPPNQHKMLILVSKVLQNLSNGISFGAKEKGMAQLNEFIESNIAKMRALFQQLSVVDDSHIGGGGGGGNGREEALAAALAAEQVEVPRKVVEEAAARLYSFVDLNLERILTSMRDVEGDEMQKARQCAMLLGNVMEQTRASLSADSALASFRAESGGDVANIFASFRQNDDRRASVSFDIDQLRATVGAESSLAQQWDAMLASDPALAGSGSGFDSGIDGGGGVLMADLPPVVPSSSSSSSSSSEDSALALAVDIPAPVTTSALAVEVPDAPPSDEDDLL